MKNITNFKTLKKVRIVLDFILHILSLNYRWGVSLGSERKEIEDRHMRWSYGGGGGCNQ